VFLKKRGDLGINNKVVQSDHHLSRWWLWGFRKPLIIFLQRSGLIETTLSFMMISSPYLLIVFSCGPCLTLKRVW